MASSHANPLAIQVAKHDQWETAQPKLGEGILPPTPARVIITGPSGSGKTQLVVDLLTRLYGGAFERIYVFSPSVHLDSVWNVVKAYVRDTMGVPEDEECFFDAWDEDKLTELLSTQRAIIKHQKQEKAGKQLFWIAIVVDDFADSPAVMASRQDGNALNTLLVRGRHMMISTFILTQKLRLAGSILRVNAQAMVVFRLRNRLELDAIIEELSAVYDKKTLMEMYQLATAEPYSFWYVNLAAKRKEDMFWLRFEQRMVPSYSSSASAPLGAEASSLLENDGSGAGTRGSTQAPR
jgi:hypothetical protein